MAGATFIEGDSIELRTFEEEHLETYSKSFDRLEVLRNMLEDRPGGVKGHRDSLWEDWVEDDQNILLVAARDGEPAGYIFLKHEDGEEAKLGYMVREEFRRKGVAEESIRLLLDHAFDSLNYHRVLARVLETNEASKSLLEKLDFTEEGVEREKRYTAGSYRDVIRYSLLGREWGEQ